MKIKYLLFDADGTLFDYDQAELHAFRNTMNDFGIKYEHSRLHSEYKEINHAIWRDFEVQRISAKDLRVERFRRFIQKQKYDFDPQEMSDRYISFLSEGIHLIDDAKEVIDYLKDNYKISIITNGLSDVQYARIYASELKDSFEHIFISEEIGFPKPSREIFDHVFTVLGHPAKDEVMIIGDSWRSDIEGGRDYGILTCWFNVKKTVVETEFEPDYHISELKQLKDFL